MKELVLVGIVALVGLFLILLAFVALAGMFRSSRDKEGGHHHDTEKTEVHATDSTVVTTHPDAHDGHGNERARPFIGALVVLVGVLVIGSGIFWEDLTPEPLVAADQIRSHWFSVLVGFVLLFAGTRLAGGKLLQSSVTLLAVLAFILAVFVHPEDTTSQGARRMAAQVEIRKELPPAGTGWIRITAHPNDGNDANDSDWTVIDGSDRSRWTHCAGSMEGLEKEYRGLTGSWVKTRPPEGPMKWRVRSLDNEEREYAYRWDTATDCSTPATENAPVPFQEPELTKASTQAMPAEEVQEVPEPDSSAEAEPVNAEDPLAGVCKLGEPCAEELYTKY